MLTNDGMLKVADLGLVKTPAADDDPEGTSPEDRNLMPASARANVTYQGSTMGTPISTTVARAYPRILKNSHPKTHHGACGHPQIAF